MINHTEQVVRRVFAVLGATVLFVVSAPPLHGQRQTAEPFAWEGAIAAGRVLEIKGVNGSINAVPGTGSTAVVEATRTGRRSDPNEVEIIVLEHAAGITVCALYPSSGFLQTNECLPGDAGRNSTRNNDVRVDFTVQVPAGVDFVARTVNGEVLARGLSSDIEARSVNGDVRVDGGTSVVVRTTNGSVAIRSSGYASASSTNGSIEADLTALDGSMEPLSFTTTNGGITLRVPGNLNATLDARTSNGRIESDLPVMVQGTFGRNRLEGTIGSGGRLLELRTTNGRIHLERGS